MIWLSDVDLCLWLIDANDLIEWCRFVSQCVAVCCSVLQYDSWTRTIWLSDVDLRYSVLQCAAVCCSVLQCVAVWLIDTNDRIEWSRFVLQRVAVCCSVLQCAAVCCSMTRRHERYDCVMLICVYESFLSVSMSCDYGVATISKLLQIVNLFCKRAL